MAEQPAAPGDGGAVQRPTEGGRAEQLDPATIDWEAAENSPEFKEMLKKKRAFVLPATIFFFVWYFGFILLAGYAEDFMATRLIDGLTLGYALALTQFIMVWGLSYAYIKKADRDFDPLARRAAAKAVEAGRRGGARGSEAGT
jgi:uncharacterized membrane protein (DUF485 family)